jgi:hypothetical protein
MKRLTSLSIGSVFAFLLSAWPALVIAATKEIEAVPAERGNPIVIWVSVLGFLGVCVWFIVKIYSGGKKDGKGDDAKN